MNQYYIYNSPRVERAKRLKCRHQRIENLKILIKAILTLTICYGMMWLLIGIVMLITN